MQPATKSFLQNEILRITSKDNLNYLNMNNQFTLSGTIFSHHRCAANWTIRNSSINLAYVGLVSGIKVGLPWQWSTVSLLVKPSALGLSRVGFQFELRCGSLNSSVLVIPNMPPIGGSISVFPSMGYEVETPFIFKAMRWIDKDIPLGYQFTYTTLQSSQLGVGARSPFLNSTTSFLPAGSATAHYSLNCSVRVYDAYGAASLAASSVTVRPVSSQVAQAFVLSAINTSSSGISLGMINLLGTLLSKVNCSGSPNCASLYRNPCSSVNHTCGSCFSGYVGEYGSRNSPCVNLRGFSVLNTSISSQRKLCLYNCSGHGQCTYTHSNTGERVDSCNVLSTSCEAVCICSKGFAGSFCSVTKTELERKQKIRGVLLGSLLNLTQHSSSASAVTALVSSLSTQTANSDEIPEASSFSVLGIANALISSAKQFEVDQQDISSQLLQSIDAVASAWNHSRQSPSGILETLQNFVRFSSSQMYPSQDSVANALSNFKTSVNTLSSAIIAVPLSPLELLAGERSSEVDLSDIFRDDFAVVQSTRFSLVELKASFFSKNSSFKSNPLVISYSIPQGQHMNLSTSRFIIVTLVNNGPFNAEDNAMNFSTSCHRRQYLWASSSRRYVCPSSGYVIVHNCTNKVGVLTTVCPQYRPSCSSFVDVHHPSCELVSFSANLTVCNCSLSRETASTRRRLDSSSGDTVVTTTLQVVAMGRYLVEQVGETLSASPSLASLDTIEHVVIVISMFASMWVIGLALVSVGRWAKGEKAKVRVEGPVQTATTPLSIRQEFAAYIEEVIPSIFRGESDAWKSFKEVFQHHKYAALVNTYNLNPLNVTRIVTVQSMLMFILTVTYDLQSPSDDGSCVQWLTESLCTQRKSYLDSTQSYCQWEVTSTDDMGLSVSGYACSYRDPYPTPQEVLGISVIVSVVTALFLRPMECIFKILSAPISNRIRAASSSSKHTRRGSTDDSSFAELLKNHHISKMAGIQVRDIPEKAIATRSMARKSLLGLTKVSSPSGGQPTTQTGRKGEARLDRLGTANQFFLVTDDTFSKDVLKVNLTMAINHQRRVLSGIELDEFDSQWGILRNTEAILARTQSSDLSDVLFISGMFDSINHDVESVRSRALAKIEALRVTTEEQTGLELLHLFIVDLLGRDSSAAMIFQSKIGEDFEQTKVVKYNKKVAAAAVLVALNILFAYYSILYGSVRGEAWQMIYLGACLAQFFIEICINETLECLWLNYIVPKLAAKEVIAAHRVLVNLMETFCTINSQPLPTSTTTSRERRGGLLNAPDYLFVSTNVARAFPSLMEALIVQSYRTPLPGESAKQWRMTRWQRFLSHIHTPHRGNVFFRLSMMLSLTVWAMLEYGATAPYLLQKMFVRFCQPFLVSGIVLAFYLVIESPLYITLFFVSAAAAVFFANRRRLFQLASRRLMDVTPLPSSPSSSPLDNAVQNNSGKWSEEDEEEPPSPLNSSEEGSFYSSLPVSSAEISHSIELEQDAIHLSVNDEEEDNSSDDNGYGSGDDHYHSSDDGISIHIPSSAYF